jgi:hypothetical protein
MQQIYAFLVGFHLCNGFSAITAKGLYLAAVWDFGVQYCQTSTKAQLKN